MSWLKFHQIVLWKETAKLLEYLMLCSQGWMVKTTKTTSAIIKCWVFLFRFVCVCVKGEGDAQRKKWTFPIYKELSTAQQQPNPNKSRTPLKKISNSRVRHSPCSMSSTLPLCSWREQGRQGTVACFHCIFHNFILSNTNNRDYAKPAAPFLPSSGVISFRLERVTVKGQASSWLGNSTYTPCLGSIVEPQYY